MPSSLKKNTRATTSQQDSTWQKAVGTFNDQPKGNPGPGQYRVEEGELMEYKNKSASLTPGFTFPRKGENPLEVFGSAEKIITASVGSYDLDDKYSMVK
jgi:hypothetical protein